MSTTTTPTTNPEPPLHKDTPLSECKAPNVCWWHRWEHNARKVVTK